MAYMCYRIFGKECDGCMRCREKKIEGVCTWCGEDIYDYEDFKYIDNELYCENCYKEKEEEDENEN